MDPDPSLALVHVDNPDREIRLPIGSVDHPLGHAQEMAIIGLIPHAHDRRLVKGAGGRFALNLGIEWLLQGHGSARWRKSNRTDPSQPSDARHPHGFATSSASALQDLKPWPRDWVETPDLPLSYPVEKMKLSKDKTSLQGNESLTLAGIPPEVYRYRLGNRSALDWAILIRPADSWATSPFLRRPPFFVDLPFFFRIAVQ